MLIKGEFVEEYTRNNHSIFPRSIRCLMIGTSGCGKTSLLLKLLLTPGMLDFEKLIICAPSTSQPGYQYLIKGFECGCGKEFLHGMMICSYSHPLSKDYTDKIFDAVKELRNKAREVEKNEGDALTEEEENILRYFNSVKRPSVEVISELNSSCNPFTWGKETNKVIVFDDMLDEEQEPIEKFFTKGRHQNFDTFYLAQSYFRIPKQCIRSNANMLILFKLSADDLKHIYRNHCSDIKWETLEQLCRQTWSTDHGFVVIDHTKPTFKGKYRNGLYRFIDSDV